MRKKNFGHAQKVPAAAQKGTRKELEGNWIRHMQKFVPIFFRSDNILVSPLYKGDDANF